MNINPVDYEDGFYHIKVKNLSEYFVNMEGSTVFFSDNINEACFFFSEAQANRQLNQLPSNLDLEVIYFPSVDDLPL